MAKPVLFVAGLGRCGTSLVMNMLDRAGVPCYGAFPGYEGDDIQLGRITAPFLAAHRGHAIKWLDPFHNPVPFSTSWITIWLDRDADEQAKSQGKFLGLPLNRKQRKLLASQLLKDRAASLSVVSRHAHNIVSFEQVITHPLVMSRKIVGWLAPWFGQLDAEAMAGAVLVRSPKCQPGVDIEMAGIRQAELS